MGFDIILINIHVGLNTRMPRVLSLSLVGMLLTLTKKSIFCNVIIRIHAK